MPPEGIQPGTPEDWLRHARSDLALARAGMSDDDVLVETLCFHTQQAAEKAVKAVLVHVGAELARTHDLGRLIEMLPSKIAVTDEVRAAAILTDYAVVTRYPADTESLSTEDLATALRLAEAVVAWAKATIASP